MDRRLTRRQQQFLTQFVDIFRETGKPLTYPYIAKKMHIGKISVYEMLRHLEYNGFVNIEHCQNGQKSGPGRPPVYFIPTTQAFDLTQRLVTAPLDLESWHAHKEVYLDILRKQDPVIYSELRGELLNRVHVRKPPLLHVTEMATILLLTICILPQTEKLQLLREKLIRLGLPGELSLYTLYGIALAISCWGLEDDRVTEELINNISRYEYYLQDMHTDNHQRICGYIREAARLTYRQDQNNSAK